VRPRLLQLVCLFPLLAGCASSGGGSSTGTPSPAPNPPSPSGNVAVTISPKNPSLGLASSVLFSANVTGSSNTTVTWTIDDVPGGNPTIGTISATGNYTAPPSLPSPPSVTVKATSVADSTKSDSTTLTFLSSGPFLTAISPTSVPLGNFSIAVTGSNFVSGSKVFYANTALPTTFVSSTQLTATGNAPLPGSVAIIVQNPGPPSSTSNMLFLQVNSVTQTSSCSQMSVGQGASLNGFRPFPSDNLWNKDISSAPVDSNSTNIINFIGASAGLHADFGAGQYQGSTIGIPYTVVDSTQPLIPINYTAYGSESDPGPLPIPLSAPIEGYPNPGNGDRHVLVLDTSTCFLYELYNSHAQSANWNADSGAVWDLLSDEQRPYTWTSADAAGLPIFPGLVRYDEVSAGAINHAIRFTVPNSKDAFTPPASHAAGTSNDTNAPPMGTRFRLKANFNISGFSAANQVILNAMKKYGLILADNGSAMYISGAPDDRFDNSDLHNLGSVTASNFEVIQITPLYTNNSLPSGSAPNITLFAASSTNVASGMPVTLSWQVTGASYVVISPAVGTTRSTSVSVTPTANTTYTLYATNAFGQTTATVSITTH
jgi:hypothetical protein